MSQISRIKLKNKVYDSILHNLFVTVSKINKEQVSQVFLENLLTRTEKVVLAKRLAIALLLESGKGYSEIKDLVKVSSSTISNVNDKLESNRGYRKVVRRLHSLEAKKENSWLFDLISSKSSLKSRNRILNHFD